MKENKEAKITIRLYTREKDYLKEVSAKSGMGISEIVRGLIEEYIAKGAKQ